jgi:hypothetical protein
MQYHNNLKEDSELLHCNTKDTCPGFPLKVQRTSCVVIVHKKLKLTVLAVIFEG